MENLTEVVSFKCNHFEEIRARSEFSGKITVQLHQKHGTTQKTLWYLFLKFYATVTLTMSYAHESLNIQSISLSEFLKTS